MCVVYACVLVAVQMDRLRQAKEVAVKSSSEQRSEIESLTQQLNGARQKLASTNQKLQVIGTLLSKIFAAAKTFVQICCHLTEL